MFEGPFFDFGVDFGVSVSKVLQDSRRALGYDGSSDALEWISLNLNVLEALMLTDEVWKLLNVVVHHHEHLEILQEVHKGCWHLCDLVSADVDCF